MRFLLILALFVSLAGCQKGYDPALMSRLNAAEHKLVGKYKLEIEVTGEGSKQFKEIMQAMAGKDGDTTLECQPDKSFQMRSSGVDVHGTWTLEKETLWLAINKVGDQKPSEIQPFNFENMKSGFDLSSAEREKFLKDFSASMALEQAESLSKLRVGVDGMLYADAGEPTLFGSFTSYFKKEAQ